MNSDINSTQYQNNVHHTIIIKHLVTCETWRCVNPKISMDDEAEVLVVYNIRGCTHLMSQNVTIV